LKNPFQKRHFTCEWQLYYKQQTTIRLKISQQMEHTRQQLPVTFSKINQSAPISEMRERKKSNSAIMTPIVTQKRGIFVTDYAKTALANYLL
jgi:hypothetical protein